jgi:methionine synthase II (cobalamin-independent)
VKRSTDKIRTTQAGRLPNSPGCDDLPIRLFKGETIDPTVLEAGLEHVVRRQLDIGVDIIGDGEFWKSRSFSYYSRHLTGVETRGLKPGEPVSTRVFTRERDEFAGFYKDLDATGTIFHVPGEKRMPPAARSSRKERRRSRRRSRHSRRALPSPAAPWTKPSCA